MRRHVPAFVMMPDSGWFDLVRDRGSQRAEGRDPRDMCELGTRPVQRLLGQPGLRHVLNGADEERAARDALDQVGQRTDVFHLAAPGDDPEGQIEIRLATALPDQRVLLT